MGGVNPAFLRAPDVPPPGIVDGHLRFHPVAIPELPGRARLLTGAGAAAGAGPPGSWPGVVTPRQVA